MHSPAIFASLTDFGSTCVRAISNFWFSTACKKTSATASESFCAVLTPSCAGKTNFSTDQSPASLIKSSTMRPPPSSSSTQRVRLFNSNSPISRMPPCASFGFDASRLRNASRLASSRRVSPKSFSSAVISPDSSAAAMRLINSAGFASLATIAFCTGGGSGAIGAVLGAGSAGVGMSAGACGLSCGFCGTPGRMNQRAIAEMVSTPARPKNQ